MTALEEQKLISMVTEIYNHLGLSGKVSYDFKKQAEKDVLKFIAKKRIKGHGIEKTQG